MKKEKLNIITKWVNYTLSSLLVLFFLSIASIAYYDTVFTYDTVDDIYVSEVGLELFSDYKFGSLVSESFSYDNDNTLYICDIEISDVTPIYMNSRLTTIVFDVEKDKVGRFELLLDDVYFRSETELNTWLSFLGFRVTKRGDNEYIYSNKSYINHIDRTIRKNRDHKIEINKEYIDETNKELNKNCSLK